MPWLGCGEIPIAHPQSGLDQPLDNMNLLLDLHRTSERSVVGLGAGVEALLQIRYERRRLDLKVEFSGAFNPLVFYRPRGPRTGAARLPIWNTRSAGRSQRMRRL